MTDTSSWASHIKSIKVKEYEDSPSSHFSEYCVVPLNKYQMGNLLGLMKRSVDKNNGDWFDELIYVIQATMKNLGVQELRSNFGDVFKYDPEKPNSIYDQVYEKA